MHLSMKAQQHWQMKSVWTVLLVVGLHSCIATSNYYTAETLKDGQISLMLIGDDLLGIPIDTTTGVIGLGIYPAIGAAAGFPWRIELGGRISSISEFEGYLRHQINPALSPWFDCSLNLHYNSNEYIKYGFTVSRRLHGITPYFHFNDYRYVGKVKPSSDPWINWNEDEIIEGRSNSTRSIGLGLQLPGKRVSLMPELNYQMVKNDPTTGILHFGIGITFIAVDDKK